MEDYIVKGTEYDLMFTPNVFLNAKTGDCLIEGESYLEDAFTLYKNIMAWTKEFVEFQTTSLKLNIKLTYFNTSSSRGILLMFKMLADFQKQGKNIDVKWYYLISNEDEIVTEIEDLRIESGVIMDIIPEKKS